MRCPSKTAARYTCINRYLLPVWSKVGLSASWIDSRITIIDAVRRGEIDIATKLKVEQIADRRICSIHTERVGVTRVHSRLLEKAFEPSGHLDTNNVASGIPAPEVVKSYRCCAPHPPIHRSDSVMRHL